MVTHAAVAGFVYLPHPDRRLYVSPFLASDGEYVMRVPEPDERLSVSVALRQHGATALAASLRGVRRPVTRAALARLLLAQPLLPQRMSALIRAHGIALWARRVPIAPRTPHLHQEEVR